MVSAKRAYDKHFFRSMLEKRQKARAGEEPKECKAEPPELSEEAAATRARWQRALIAAARDGRAETVRALLGRDGVDVNLPDAAVGGEGMTPLRIAAQHGAYTERFIQRSGCACFFFLAFVSSPTPIRTQVWRARMRVRHTCRHANEPCLTATTNAN